MLIQYYYLVTSLPPIAFREHKSYDAAYLIEHIEENLVGDDVRHLEYIRRQLDLKNFENYLYGIEPHFSTGNIPQWAFNSENAPEMLPPHWLELSKQKDTEIPAIMEQLWIKYLLEGMRFNGRTISLWAENELAFRVACAMMRNQSLDRDLEHLTQYDDELINTIYKHRKQHDFGIGLYYQWAYEIKGIFENYRLLDLALEIDSRKFEMLQRLAQHSHFDINHIDAYVLQLMINETSRALDADKGQQYLQAIVGGYGGE